MKFIAILSLLAALPHASSALFGASAPRDLQECVAIDPNNQGENMESTCCMPMTIDTSALTSTPTVVANVLHSAGDDDIAYWFIVVESGPLVGLRLSGWCVDLSRGLGSGTKTFEMFSTYDDWNYDHALDSPEKLPNVNWMINNFHLGETITVPAGANNYCDATNSQDIVVDWNTFQNAVWRTVDLADRDDGVVHEQSGANKCLEWYMRGEAESNGNNFEPDCTDPDAEMAVLLVYNDVIGDNTINGQVIIGEVKLAETDFCKPQLCCEEDVVNHETFQENKEIPVTFTKGEGGSSGAYWSVEFLASELPDVYSTLVGPVEAWSVDLDRDDAGAEGTFLVDTYSTYDNWYRFNAVDKKQNIPKVNYLINNLPVGSPVSGCTNTVVSVDDFQNAVWDLMDTLGATTNRGGEECVIQYLVSEANANGAAYEPSCADSSTDKLAVLLIVDGGDTYKRKYAGGWYEDLDILFDTVENQVIVAAVPIKSISDGCMMEVCNCCDPEPTPAPISATFDFNTPDGNEERDAPVSAPTTVDELSTPAPVSRVAQCDDPIDILGSELEEFCGHLPGKGVEVLNTSPSDAAPPLRIDILDTFYGIVPGSTDALSISFRAQNPFAGGAVDMYVQYETRVSGARVITCEADPGVNECNFMGNGNVMDAVCVDPRPHNADAQPYTLVTVYFVDKGADLFPVKYTNDVSACCEPDVVDADSVLVYTFEILCTCPNGAEVFTRE
jgi:hypothetical protein